MISIQISDATGPALDWLVAKAIGLEVVVFQGQVHDLELLRLGADTTAYAPSTDRWQAMALLETKLVSLEPQYLGTKGRWDWSASMYCPDAGENFWMEGPTPPIAICRCVALSQLRVNQRVPEELRP